MCVKWFQELNLMLVTRLTYWFVLLATVVLLAKATEGIACAQKPVIRLDSDHPRTGEAVYFTLDESVDPITSDVTWELSCNPPRDDTTLPCRQMRQCSLTTRRPRRCSITVTFTAETGFREAVTNSFYVHPKELVLGIDVPRSGSQVTLTQDVAGTFGSLPEGWELWGVAGNQHGQLYPEMIEKRDDGAWAKPGVAFGGATSGIREQFTYRVAALDPEEVGDLSKELSEMAPLTGDQECRDGVCFSSPVTVTRIGPTDCWYFEYPDSGETKPPREVSRRSLVFDWPGHDRQQDIQDWRAVFVRRMDFSAPGGYTLYGQVSGGAMTVTKDGKEVLSFSSRDENGLDKGLTARQTTVTPEPEDPDEQEIRIEFERFSSAPAASLRFWIWGPDESPERPVQQDGKWLVENYANRELKYDPISYLTPEVKDAPDWALDQDWGEAGPTLTIEEVITNYFSSWITATRVLDSGFYHFDAQGDDAVRFRLVPAGDKPVATDRWLLNESEAYQECSSDNDWTCRRRVYVPPPSAEATQREYDIVVQHEEGEHGAFARLRWAMVEPTWVRSPEDHTLSNASYTVFDDGGNLWTVAEGVQYFHPLDPKTDNPPYQGRNPVGYSYLTPNQAQVNVICPVKDAGSWMLWIGERDTGRVLIYNQGSWQVADDNDENEKVFFVGGGHINDIVLDNDGNVWVGDSEACIIKGTRSAEGFSWKRAEESMIRKPVTTLAVDKKGAVWAGTDQGGVWIYGETKEESEEGKRSWFSACSSDSNYVAGRESDGKWAPPRTAPQASKSIEAIWSDEVTDIVQLGDDDYWISTAHNGIVRYTPGTNEANKRLAIYGPTVVMGKQDLPEGFRINTLWADSKNQWVWVGTSHGVSCYTGRENEKFDQNLLGWHYFPESEQKGAEIRTIWGDGQGNIYVGFTGLGHSSSGVSRLRFR